MPTNRKSDCYCDLPLIVDNLVELSAKLHERIHSLEKRVDDLMDRIKTLEGK